MKSQTKEWRSRGSNQWPHCKGEQVNNCAKPLPIEDIEVLGRTCFCSILTGLKCPRGLMAVYRDRYQPSLKTSFQRRKTEVTMPEEQIMKVSDDN